MVLLVKHVELLAEDGPMKAPAGLVFSTSPSLWIDRDDVRWVVKRGVGVAVAELVAHELATSLGVPVPEHAWAILGDDTCFCSMLVDGHRDVSPWLRRPSHVMNWEDIARTIALDAWIENDDRNLFGLIARSSVDGPPGAVNFVFIDFEKARALQPMSLTSINNPASRDLWPSGDLGRALRSAPLGPPDAAFTRLIERDGPRLAHDAVSKVAATLGGRYDWFGSTERSLSRRAMQISTVLKEVWG